jgi:hypothetical protein
MLCGVALSIYRIGFDVKGIVERYELGLIDFWIESLFIILNTPQLCCGDGHETDLRLKHAISIDVGIAACKPLCL